MNGHEKREKPRTDTHNLISYVYFDENNNPLGQGMGRTMNISEGGILLETHAFIDPQYILSFTISLEDEMMDVRGRVPITRSVTMGCSKQEFSLSTTMNQRYKS
jgi:hypothetical protein